jgi:hypothetical protein
MTAIISDLEKYKYIEPQQVLAYLITHGWQQQQQIGDKASVWTLNDFEILLPLKPEIIDFSRRMSEVFETLALAENRLQINILSELITSIPSTSIQGVVTDIATPNVDNLSGEITLLGVIVDKLRPIKTELADRDYILALKAYQERLPVLCMGDLIKDGNLFILKNPHQFMIGDRS